MFYNIWPIQKVAIFTLISPGLSLWTELGMVFEGAVFLHGKRWKGSSRHWFRSSSWAMYSFNCIAWLKPNLMFLDHPLLVLYSCAQFDKLFSWKEFLWLTCDGEKWVIAIIVEMMGKYYHTGSILQWLCCCQAITSTVQKVQRSSRSLFWPCVIHFDHLHWLCMSLTATSSLLPLKLSFVIVDFVMLLRIDWFCAL